MNAANGYVEKTLTVNADGAIVVPAAMVADIELQPGQQVEVMHDGQQLRLTRPEVHAYADWRDISHQLLDDS
ncbi:MAG: AbrB/MazE/SpoVT family DNA-binding domain-containing protein [Pseudomonadota bacterium]